MNLTIAGTAVPDALVPVASVVDVLGVEPEQVNDWCRLGKLRAVSHLGQWWVTVADLTWFVEQSRWAFVAPPPDRPPLVRRGRRREKST